MSSGVLMPPVGQFPRDIEYVPTVVQSLVRVGDKSISESVKVPVPRITYPISVKLRESPGAFYAVIDTNRFVNHSVLGNVSYVMVESKESTVDTRIASHAGAIKLSLREKLRLLAYGASSITTMVPPRQRKRSAEEMRLASVRRVAETTSRVGRIVAP